MINSTCKTILQNTKAVLQHTGIQYAVKILANQGRCLSWPVPWVKFNVFIYFFFQVVFNICLFKSLLLVDQMPQNFIYIKIAIFNSGF